MLLDSHFINNSTHNIFFRFRALVLITLATIILLAKAVLLTKDIAVCVPLDSKVQDVRKVTPVMSNGRMLVLTTVSYTTSKGTCKSLGPVYYKLTQEPCSS